MRFATIDQGGELAGAVVTADGALSLLSDIDPTLHSVKQVIELGEEALLKLSMAVRDRAGSLPADSVRWAAPVPDPAKMLFIALNNSAVDKVLVYRPDFPAYFPKLPSALTGNLQPIEIYPHYGLTHPEPELGIVIGRGGRHISMSDAMDHVFGYTIVNDVTSVGMRLEDNFFARTPLPKSEGGMTVKDEYLLYQGRYKGADTFAPMGPFLVHKSEVPDPMKLRVRGWIDDEQLMDDNTSNLHFSIAEVIYWISLHTTLVAGDIISLGTAVDPDTQGKPPTHWNIGARGGVVRIEIEGLGVLTNPIRRIAEAADPRQHFSVHKRFRSRLTESSPG